MIRIFGPAVPDEIYVACSGGVDSMAAFDFLNNKSYRKVTAAFFHHGTEDSERAFRFLRDYLGFRDDGATVNFRVGFLTKPKPPRKSPEEHWRDERYKFLDSLGGPVVTAHHLNDCAETLLFSTFNGTPKTIPYRRREVIRPFLTTPKSELIAWCEKRGVPWIKDKSNEDVSYARNRIRHNIMPEVLKVNPGFLKVVARKVEERIAA